MNLLHSPFLPLLLLANSVATAAPSTSGHGGADMRSLSFELAFEQDAGNGGQAPRFSSRGPGYGLFLNSEGAMLRLLTPDGSRFETLQMRLAGGARELAPTGLHELPGFNHYYSGQDPSTWREACTRFGAVRCDGVYPGVDLVFYGTAGELEYDFLVAPGADPSVIRIAFGGAEQFELEAGELHIRTTAGGVVQRAPVVYQEIDSERVLVDAEYVLAPAGAHEVGFLIGAYDKSLPLVIDPILSYASFLGGASDEAFQGGLVLDAAGNMLISGWTTSPNFPTVNEAQSSLGTNIDAVIVKLAPDGQSILYSTFFGGSKPSGEPASSLRGREEAWGIAVDAAGNAYVTGDTCSPNMPVTPGAYDIGCGTDGSCNTGNGFYDTFVAKLSPSGTLVYSTFLGGSSYDRPLGGIAVDAAGNAYVAGWTSSLDFPTTPGAFDTTFNGMSDAFVSKLSADGSTLIYSTFIGGGVGPSVLVPATDTPYAIAVDGQGSVYLGGETGSVDFPTTSGVFQETMGLGGGKNGYLLKLSPDGSSLVFSTYLEDIHTKVTDLVVGDAGQVWVGGDTNSQTFPTTAGAFQPNTLGSIPDTDAFIAKFNPSASTILAATYLSTADDDFLAALGVDSAGNVYTLCSTDSTTFPLVDPLYASVPGIYRAAVSRFSPDLGSLTFSTLLGFGAHSGEMDVSAVGAIHVAGRGSTGANGQPVSPQVNALAPFGGGSTDAYVAVIDGLSQCDAPNSYCGTSPNSVGSGALIGYQNTASISSNNLVLQCTNLVPGTFGLFFYGANQVSLPLGHGIRCVGGSLTRLAPQAADGLGFSSLSLDFNSPPFGSGPGAVTVGDVRNFQYWYRDPAAGAPGNNLSDGLEVTFCP